MTETRGALGHSLLRSFEFVCGLRDLVCGSWRFPKGVTMRDRYRDFAEEILDSAGIGINGKNPWDIQVRDPRFFRRAIAEGQLGVGESYMDGWWDVPQLDEFINRVLRARVEEKLRHSWSAGLQVAMTAVVNLQSKSRAFVIGKRHYDLGNELFIRMLDKRMNYSCAYWDDADSLDEAQEKKLDLICRKLCLRSGMRVLDIGCGWGAFGKFAAERYGVSVTGLTVSRQQVELGRKLCEGLPVEFQLLDYRDVAGTFDRIVSVGMIEHVGYRNYRTYFEVAHRCLTDDGLFLLHTIGGNRSSKSINAWTHKYIFPNGMLPSVAQIGKAIEGLFVMEDWHSFGPHYDKTLMAWYRNFDANWPSLKDHFDDRFYRMWKYYLVSSAGAFRARYNQLWQIVLSKGRLPGGYESFR
jgi:cyclopropane-fatty-acyl-phospholipid synthase